MRFPIRRCVEVVLLGFLFQAHLWEATHPTAPASASELNTAKE